VVDVSVVMPLRNAASYVEEAVRSVLAQSHRDLELVVVDDGSTDGSREIVAAIADPRIRLVPGPRTGFPGAWNAGLAAAAGRLFVQCDADDVLPPDRIARQVAYLAAHPDVAAVCGGLSTMDPAGRPVMTYRPAGSGVEDITAELLEGRTRTSFCTYAVPVAALRTLGGMREYFESGCDLDLQIRLAEAGPVRFEPAAAYVYRLHDASLTHRQASDRREFFEAYARELRRQRAAGGPDDLQRGRPRTPPDGLRAASSSAGQIQGMLVGEAWRAHRDGRKCAAVGLGLRSVAQRVWSLSAWKNLAALIVKPVPHERRSP
jgi:glycosyltransferase involved in cell wall biosynthesis